jgi:hypothetical protein
VSGLFDIVYCTLSHACYDVSGLFDIVYCTLSHACYDVSGLFDIVYCTLSHACHDVSGLFDIVYCTLSHACHDVSGLFRESTKFKKCLYKTLTPNTLTLTQTEMENISTVLCTEPILIERSTHGQAYSRLPPFIPFTSFHILVSGGYWLLPVALGLGWGGFTEHCGVVLWGSDIGSPFLYLIY